MNSLILILALFIGMDERVSVKEVAKQAVVEMIADIDLQIRDAHILHDEARRDHNTKRQYDYMDRLIELKQKRYDLEQLAKTP